MTEKQQIIEMARLQCNRYRTDGICKSDFLGCDGNCAWYMDAESLYNKGCRLVPEGAVVLTREEYNALLLEQKRLKEIVDRIPCGYELKDKARKETAKGIYIAGKYYYAKHSPTERQLSDFLAHIKETYDVEVE